MTEQAVRKLGPCYEVLVMHDNSCHLLLDIEYYPEGITRTSLADGGWRIEYAGRSRHMGRATVHAETPEGVCGRERETSVAEVSYMEVTVFEAWLQERLTAHRRRSFTRSQLRAKKWRDKLAAQVNEDVGGIMAGLAALHTSYDEPASAALPDLPEALRELIFGLADLPMVRADGLMIVSRTPASLGFLGDILRA